MDALAGLLSLPQESDGKEAERQLRLQVALARSEAENLVHDYVSFFSRGCVCFTGSLALFLGGWRKMKSVSVLGTNGIIDHFIVCPLLYFIPSSSKLHHLKFK